MVDAIAACSVVLALAALHGLARYPESRPQPGIRRALHRFLRHGHERWLSASELQKRR